MAQVKRRILVTGANGFIGKNLVVRLSESTDCDVNTFVRGDDVAKLPDLVEQVDAIIHLAGENRPTNEEDFAKINTGLTSVLCDAIYKKFKTTGCHTTLILASSAQADRDNFYGRSKLAAEQAVEVLAQLTGNPCVVFRFPGVFGKWCKPNYNSVVATFCHNIARDLPIQINDPAAILKLVYIDDVVDAVLASLITSKFGYMQAIVNPEYKISLEALANQIRTFREGRSTLIIGSVGGGLARALYATYVSYLPKEKFSYEVQQHVDQRGVFVEMLKTPDTGQFSYFTAHPGITRGGHYHHTKTEKFLVIKGKALFRFRNLITGELVEIRTSGAKSEVVDTIPGWTHDITNIGSDEMVVMLWANENFDRQKPDTIAKKI